MLTRCDGCTTKLGVTGATGALGATGAGARPTLRSGGATGATGLPDVVFTGAVAAEEDAPVGATLAGAVDTGGLVVTCGVVVTGDLVVTDGAGSPGLSTEAVSAELEASAA